MWKSFTKQNVSFDETFLNFTIVVIIAKSTIEGYSRKHPIVAEPLNFWYSITKRENWGNFEDVRKSFNSADVVGNDRYCFDIKGNEFRLIALIIFKTRTAFILWFGTHAEYDKLNKRVGAANVTFNK